MSVFDIVLYEPEIPSNTGNIIRICANIGAGLHLIHPLGFELDDKKLRRAGLDYHEWVRVREYPSLDDFVETACPNRLFPFSTRGQRSYHEISYAPGDAFLFGPETRGLPDRQLAAFSPDNRLFLPMQANSRSLNLSNAVAVVLYEAWRQVGFNGAALR